MISFNHLLILFQSIFIAVGLPITAVPDPAVPSAQNTTFMVDFYSPRSFQNNFIFIVDQVPEIIDQNKSPQEYQKFLEKSIPFSFKSKFQLFDYFVSIVTPTSKSEFDVSSALSLFLLFKEVPGDFDSKEALQFWDSLTTKWIDPNLTAPLIFSRFCTLNSMGIGYCLELSKEGYIILIKVGGLQSNKASTLAFEQNVKSSNTTINNDILLKDSFWSSQLTAKTNSSSSLWIDQILNRSTQLAKITFKELAPIHSSRVEHYSQVVDPNKMKFRTRTNASKREELEMIALQQDETPCAEVTWYNVLHNSVFGKPQLCH